MFAAVEEDKVTGLEGASTPVLSDCQFSAADVIQIEPGDFAARYRRKGTGYRMARADNQSTKPKRTNIVLPEFSVERRIPDLEIQFEY